MELPIDPTNPNPPSVTSVASVRCFLSCACFSPGSDGVTDRSHQPNPPSVTSVASVRCFPVALVSRPEAAELPNRSHQPESPSVTSVRCFLSCACFSRGSHGVTDRSHQPQSPSVTSVTSVRCFPPLRLFRARKPRSHRIDPTNPNPPFVTSVTRSWIAFLPEAT
jgi:hypothetical protein